METLMSGNEKILFMMYAVGKGFSFDGRKTFDELNKNLQSEIKTAAVKPSVFNFCVETPKKILVYNTLYNAMLKLTPDEFLKLNGKQPCDEDLRRKFLESGLLVTADIDERESYRLWRQESRKNSNHLSVNITTTLKCNARCPYCYEHGVKHVDFDETKIDALIDFIKEHKKDSPVKLNWFGGEPFLNPKIIDEVTRRLGEAGLEYETFAITNGSLITRRLIEGKFKKWNLRGVQITLDGTAEQYAKRKGYVDGQQAVFKKILNRIAWLAEANIHVDIRLNTDRENMNDILNLIYVLQARFDGKKTVVYYPAFVTGVKDKLSDAEKVSFVKEIFRATANPEKLSINNRLYSFPRTLPCMRNDPQAFSVDVYGRIYNCEHLVGRKEKALGTLKRLSDKVNKARLDEPLREECVACVFLPKCMSGCASNMRTGDAACMIERYMIQAYMEFMCE
ncbi:MAG: radical SAM protein [Selenomonadaceae bacterium]|nr:radical SAM protein [Selenomonadaceae bacterium]